MKESDRPAPRQAKFYNIDDFRSSDSERQADESREKRLRKVGRNVINLKTQPKLTIEAVMKDYFLKGDLDTVEEMLKAESKSDTPEDAMVAVLEVAAERDMSEESDLEDGSGQSEQPEMPANVVPINRFMPPK